MVKPKHPSRLHNPNPVQAVEEVIIMADIVGKSEITLQAVIKDFLEIVPNPLVAGGLAAGHHGFVRATVDVDMIAMSSVSSLIPKFVGRGYKHESIQLPIGHLDMLTKGNKGVDFIHLNDDAFRKSIESRAVIGLLLQQQIHYVALEDLIILKSLALKGRTKKIDEADLEELEPKPHDKAYVEKWKKHFCL